MVICLERGADLHMAQLMPLPLTVCCFSKIQTDFTFLVLGHLGSPGQRAVKWVCVYVAGIHTHSRLTALCPSGTTRVGRGNIHYSAGIIARRVTLIDYCLSVQNLMHTALMHNLGLDIRTAAYIVGLEKIFGVYRAAGITFT